MPTIDEKLITTDKVPYLSRQGVQVSVLRTDKIHPVISGNKWFKLKFYLQEAKDLQKQVVVTYGGPYSNHIVATAAASSQLGFKSVGIIRGEEPQVRSHTLSDALRYGMELQFLLREDYRSRNRLQNVNDASCYYIPEGGYGKWGALGAGTIPYEKDQFDTILCAVGTGTMVAGLINSKMPHTKVIGISMFRNNFSLEEEIRALVTDRTEKIHLLHDYHFGGYARRTPDLFQFMNDFYSKTGIPTDFVYTGKLFYAAHDLVQKQYFTEGERVLIIHCGGLQGNLSLPKGLLIF